MPPPEHLADAPAPDWLLAKNVEHLQLVLDRAEFGTFEHDLGSAQVRVSRLTCRLYGLDRERDEVPLAELLSFVDPAAMEERRRVFEQAQLPHSDGLYELQYRVGPPDYRRWLSVRGRVVWDPARTDARIPLRVVGIVSDVTAQKQQEESLETVYAMLDAIGSSTDAFMYVKDRHGRMLYCNAAVLRSLQRTRDEVIGRTDREFLGPGVETDAIMAHDADVMRLGRPQIYKETLRTVQRVYLSTKTPYRDWRGEVVGIAGVSLDITELEHTRQALADSEERASLATEAAGIGVYEYDPRTDRIIWSPSLRQQFGLDDEEAVTLDTAIRRIHPDDRERVTAAVAAAMDPAGDGRYDIVYRTVPVDGEQRWLHVLGRVRFEEEGGVRRPVRFAGVSINVTREREMEEALREADRRKDEFLAMLAHELRNPLAPLLYAASALDAPQLPAASVRRVAEVVHRQTRHMARLVDDLLDASRVSLGKISIRKELLDLRDVVRAGVESGIPAPMRAQRDVTVEVGDAGPVWVDGDAVRLTQLVSNLAGNAAKFTAAGGHIRVRLSAAEGWAVIRVEDDGEGITAALLPHVFELFVQGDRSLDRPLGGLGIGLPLVRALAQLHGGSATAHSEGPGRGAAFEVRLPLAQAQEPAPASGGVPAAGRRKILIVEDNADSAETLKMMLELEGHEVATAGEGAQGVALAAQGLPGVMLVDIGLPGMSGFEVARQVRAQPRLAGTRLVALTGYGAPEDRERTRAAGFDLHLVKPVSLEDLNRALAGE